MILQAPSSWLNGNPPREWKRLMACDVGGGTAWAFEWAAVDPWGNLIFYDEINMVTTNMDVLAELAKPKMLNEQKEPYSFQATIIDYENKIAADDLRRRGIAFTNAQKHAKAASIQRLSGYLHRNPKHHFPDWHPLAGKPNSPRCFITTKCRGLIKELPQQRWKEEVGGDGRLKNEMDRSVVHDCVDCALYIARELPDPTTLKVNPYSVTNAETSKISQLYWFDVKRQEEMKTKEGRRLYKPMFTGVLDSN